MMRNKKKIVALVIAAMLSLSALCTIGIPALAYTGSNNAEDLESLFNETNTFEGAEISETTDNNRVTEKEQYVVTYDMTNRVEKPVMSYAQITVLNHGLASSASTWSGVYNEDKSSLQFMYDADSLISKLSEGYGGANIYWARGMSTKSNFNLYEITEQRGVYQATSTYLVNQITDISQHIIIVYQSSESNASNNNAYYEFNCMLSKIIKDVKMLNGGILPKVNLIGHSRGGITNLQYALDHPDLVENLISVGTPYFGSTTANLFGEAVMHGENDGLTDVVNPSVYNSYRDRWNNSYSSLYDDIKVVAVGGYSSLLFLREMLDYDYSGEIEKMLNPELIKLAVDLVFGERCFPLAWLRSVSFCNLFGLNSSAIWERRLHPEMR